MRPAFSRGRSMPRRDPVGEVDREVEDVAVELAVDRLDAADARAQAEGRRDLHAGEHARLDECPVADDAATAARTHEKLATDVQARADRLHPAGADERRG